MKSYGSDLFVNCDDLGCYCYIILLFFSNIQKADNNFHSEEDIWSATSQFCLVLWKIPIGYNQISFNNSKHEIKIKN